MTKGFTVLDLLIVFALVGFLVSVVFNAMNGTTVIPSKHSCLSQGGKWTEGYERGRMTQLCTYDSKL